MIAILVLLSKEFVQKEIVEKDKIAFSHGSGNYPYPIAVRFHPTDPNLKIVYTLDGSTPKLNSPQYLNAIFIDKSTVLRVGVIENNKITDNYSQTYLIQETSTLPIVSLTVDPVDLWSEEWGIYANKKRPEDPDAPYEPNYNKRGPEWEKPAYIEFLDTDNQSKFHSKGTVKIHGNLTRGFPQKSLKFCTENSKELIVYKMFDESDVQKYRCFLLRSGGNDWTDTLFRDALAQYLIKDTSLDIQNYRPVILFINGEYWGIHSIRDTYDEYYFNTKYGLDKGNIIIINPDREQEGYPILEEGNPGDEKLYEDMLNFIFNNDITKPEIYNRVEELIDVDNYIDYIILNTYSGNSDWGDSNVRIWRYRNDTDDFSVKSIPHGLDGRWRWIVYDMDESFNSPSGTKPTLKNAITNSARHSYWSNFLLTNLLRNSEFRDKFIKRYIYHLNTTYDPKRVIPIIDEFESEIEVEIPKHAEKWGGILALYDRNWRSFKNLDEWRVHVQILRDFTNNRQQYEINQLTSAFELPGGVNLIVNSNDNEGILNINDISTENDWNGLFVAGIKYKFEPKPNLGYSFVSLEGNDNVEIDGNNISFKSSGDAWLKANFRKNWIGKGLDFFNELYGKIQN